MTTLRRYIVRTLAVHFAAALAALVAIFSVIQLMQELGETGTGTYAPGEAAWFVLLALPNQAYWLFPAAALLGTVNGLGWLASNNEIVAMQATGVSRVQITGAVLVAAGFLAVIALLLGEGLGGPLARHAHMQRSLALTSGLGLGTANGIWARDGSRIVNVRTTVPDGTLRDVYVYDFEGRRMRTFTYARTAAWDAGRWRLHDLVEQDISADGSPARRLSTEELESGLGPRQLGVLFLPPEDLSLLDLRRTERSLRERGEDFHLHAYAFWRRASMPLIAALMAFCAVPLVLDASRRSSVGQRLIAGILIGLGFQMLNDTFARFGLNYGLSPVLSAFLPAFCVLGVGVWKSLRAT